MRVTVYKLGGSLLDLPDVAARVRGTIDRFGDSMPLIVVGGGETADLVRRWDRLHRLGDDASHALAIDAMRFNERLVTRLMPDVAAVSGRAAAELAWRSGRIALLSVAEFLADEEASLPEPECVSSHVPVVDPEFRLPRSWNVTSDSIAAWIATRWPAERLVLLKSTDRELAGDEGVDRCFASLESSLRQVEWVNLRGERYG